MFNFTKYIFILVALFLISANAYAEPGDTIRVETVEFGGPRSGFFDFPETMDDIDRVYMNYKLICPCAEWDYIAYVYIDQYFAPNFRLNSDVVDKYEFMQDTSYFYIPLKRTEFVRSETLREGDVNSEGNAISYIGEATSTFSVAGEGDFRKVQFAYSKEELESAGNLAGDITGARMPIVSGESATIYNVKVSWANVASGTYSKFEYVATTVFEADEATVEGGEFFLEFQRLLAWDGESDILLQIEYETGEGGEELSFEGIDTYSSVYADDYENLFYFDGVGVYAETESKKIADGATELTLSAWVNPRVRHNWDGIITTAGAANFTGLAFSFKNANEEYDPGFRVGNKGHINSSIPVADGEWVHIAGVWKSGEYMKLYVNGELAAESSDDVFEGSVHFNDRWYFGRDRGNNGRLFDGWMKEIRIWSAALPEGAIQDWASKRIDETHPNYDALELYYQTEKLLAKDAFIDQSGNGAHALIRGGGGFVDLSDEEILPTKPRIMFMQGEYAGELETELLRVDTVANAPMLLEYFTNPEEPTSVSESIFVWDTYSEIEYGEDGSILTETPVAPDDTIELSKTQVYFSDDYTIQDRYELFRYITPYGNGLSLGDGFTWTIDVTDFLPILTGKVYLESRNSQEDQEITFDFIKGTPARDITGFRKMWNFNRSYNSTFEQATPPIKFYMNENDNGAKLKITQTGHGWDNEDRCNEFCKKTGYVYVNGLERYSQLIWRDDCEYNPVYPQGGTWLLDRSNWCPGADVRYYDYELTDYLNLNDSNEVNYDMEFYDEPITGNVPNWVIRSFLISYGEPNFRVDAAVEDIVSPTMKDEHSRRNPIANNPVIIIKNRGSEPLTKLDIQYGIKDAGSAQYQWNGTLEFLETAEISLPAFDWGEYDEKLFEVELLNPNGEQDEYPSNNYASSTFEDAPVYRGNIEIVLKTNNYANEQYVGTLRNSDGDELLRWENLASNTEFREIFDLPYGDYVFELVNVLGYGLDSWFMREQLGTGACAMYSHGILINTFNPDFGGGIYHHFRVAPIPTIATGADTLDFGDVDLGEESYAALDIYPENDKGLEVSDIKIPFGDRNGFFIDSVKVFRDGPEYSDSSLVEYDEFLNKLEGDDMLRVYVRFAPEKAKSYRMSMTIESNDALFYSKRIILLANAIDPENVEDAFHSPEMTTRLSENPVSGEAEFIFSIAAPQTRYAEVAIYDCMGARVKTIFEGNAGFDEKRVRVDAACLAPGAYFITLRSGKSVRTTPMIIAE